MKSIYIYLFELICCVSTYRPSAISIFSFFFFFTNSLTQTWNRRSTSSSPPLTILREINLESQKTAQLIVFKSKWIYRWLNQSCSASLQFSCDFRICSCNLQSWMNIYTLLHTTSFARHRAAIYIFVNFNPLLRGLPSSLGIISRTMMSPFVLSFPFWRFSLDNRVRKTLGIIG